MPVSAENRDKAKWYQLHGCAVAVKSDFIWVKIPYICQNLVFDAGKDTCSCADYDNRPQLCRDYICQRAGGQRI